MFVPYYFFIHSLSHWQTTCISESAKAFRKVACEQQFHIHLLICITALKKFLTLTNSIKTKVRAHSGVRGRDGEWKKWQRIFKFTPNFECGKIGRAVMDPLHQMNNRLVETEKKRFRKKTCEINAKKIDCEKD